MKNAVMTALEKAGKGMEEIDGIFAGDLLNQCIASAFSARGSKVPYIGLYSKSTPDVALVPNTTFTVSTLNLQIINMSLLMADIAPVPSVLNT